jgi:methylphosphotriester-DNA--protein-cysteine methyltransferase
VELELNVVVRGAITYVVRGSRYTFPQRSLLWMFPAQEHQLVDRTDDAQYYVAVFKPAMIRSCCNGRSYQGLMNKDATGVLHTLLRPADFDLLRKTMDVLMRDSLDPDLLNREAGFGVTSDFTFRHGDPDALNAGLRHLLLLCWRHQCEGGTPGSEVPLHPAVIKALDLLGDGAWEGSLAALARQCGVSGDYLSRVFTRQMGVPLNRYRNSVRLGRFLEIQRQPVRKTLMEAAYEAGFGSYAQFYRVFTQAYGGRPGGGLKSPADGA